MDRVFLTGASGFIGSHVLRELLAAGYVVRALLHRATSGINGSVEPVWGDLSRPGDFAHALDGCRYVIHTAALYSFAPRDRAAMRKVNVEGTAGLMTAASLAGIERVVLTSSSATLGPAADGRPADEREHARDDPRDAYHQSKLDQERAAFAGRVPVVALLPTAPVGPGDWKPTPTGKLVLDFARGKIAAKAPGHGGMNLVAVEDVARAHVTALQRGNPGERYVIGGENLSLDEIWAMLCEIAGRTMPRWRAPYALALAAAYLDEMRCRVDRKAIPFVPLEGVRMSRNRMYADSSKARLELGHQPSCVRSALERAVAWYHEKGYVTR
jgi:dihydroflavonol-4-reductase